MTVISGVLTAPDGSVLPNVSIILKAIATSSAVVVQTESTTVTGQNGSYSISVKVGEYQVSISAYGQPTVSVGNIRVFADSGNGTINDFLISPGESELTPAIVAAVESMRVASQAARDETIAARDTAVTAAQSAISSGNLQPDEATGLAHTTNGQTFTVGYGSGADISYKTFENANGVAVVRIEGVGKGAVDAVAEGLEVTKNTLLPNVGIQIIDGIRDQEGVPVIMGMFDANGISPVNFNTEGGLNLDNIQILPITDNDEYISAFTDKNFVPYLGLSKLGGIIVGRTEIVEIPGPPGIVFVDQNWIPYAASPGIPEYFGQDIPLIGGGATAPAALEGIRRYDVMHVVVESQSLGLGLMTSADAAANPPLSTTQPYNNLGFSGGHNSGTSATDTAIALIEKAYTPEEGTYPGAETPCTAATSKLVELIQEQTGLAYSNQGTIYFGSAPGKGGQQISNLSKGTVPYQRMLDHVTNGLRLSAAAGKSYAVLAIIWMQGETDYSAGTTRAGYLSLLKQYISDSKADKLLITKQAFDIPFITYQLSTHRAYSQNIPVIALALRDAALSGLSYMSAPGYIFDYNSDNVHGTNYTYQMWAKYHGRIIYKLMQDDEAGLSRGMHRVDVINEIRQGVINDLLFSVPVPPLVFDTTWVTSAVNMGFDVRLKSNSTLVDIITSVSIAGPDRVRIITSRALLDTEVITYGWGRTGDPATNGRTTGPRGNLRDSEGDLPGESYTGADGILRKLHNWCVIF